MEIVSVGVLLYEMLLNDEIRKMLNYHHIGILPLKIMILEFIRTYWMGPFIAIFT
jgi:hypothetical protein